jgi:RNA polymerase sigma-70 factor (ECF subfamily)
VSGSAATPSGTAEARVAQAARASYGRLIGILSAPSNDIAGAEDALSDALQAALLTWPERGIPDNPEGWLVRVAKNRMTDAHRRALKLHPVPIEDHDLTMPEALRTERNDPRLPLLFVCAHPGIAEPARGPLMLQAVLGFTAAQIARAYVSSPAAMSKQLVRAKDRIKANAIPFRVPDTDLRSARLPDVTEAIYGCYALVWLDGPDADSIQREAVYLADLLATELGDDPEVLGLSALLAFLHSRRAARLRDGRYVPLAEQSTELWDHDLIAAADTRLRQAFRLGRPGRFQIEAAIQSVHAARARSGRTDWHALLSLYEGLTTLAPTLGAHVGRAAVVGEVHGAKPGLAALDALADPRLDRFQPFWATRAHLLARSGAVVEARDAYTRAISLTVSASARRFLETARAGLGDA